MTLNLDKTGWKRVAFGDVVRNVTERVDDPQQAGVDRYVGLEHLDPGVLTVQRWDSPEKVAAQKLRFYPGDVIFGRRRAYQKKVAMAEFEGICSAHALVLRADPNFVDPDFLPIFLASDYFLDRAISISVGSLSPTVNWRDLRVQEFDLPPLDEQKRIADLMWALERHRQALATSSVQTASAREDWLDRLFSGGEWPSKAVADIVTSGPTNGKSARSNEEGRGVPTLSISAIRGGYVRGGSSVKYMEISSDEVQKFVIEDDDFLIVRGNGNRQLTGRGGLARGGLPAGCVYPDLLIRLRFDPSVILPVFAAAQWNSTAAHAALLRNAKSTNGIWKINGKDIKSHRIVVPPVSEQRAIMDRLETLDEASRGLASELASLDALRSSLLADIFGGAA